MLGRIRRSPVKICIIAVAGAAAIFAALYYAGAFLPSYTVWHDCTVESTSPDAPDLIELKNRRVRVIKDGDVIFTTPAFCKVSNMIYTDIDRDGENELILHNFNIGKFGDARPFWIKFDPPVYRQHIYIYDYRPDEKIIRPIWMASDIGVRASDMEAVKDDVIRIWDCDGKESNWMWISFGLRCVD